MFRRSLKLACAGALAVVVNVSMAQDGIDLPDVVVIDDAVVVQDVEINPIYIEGKDYKAYPMPEVSENGAPEFVKEDGESTEPSKAKTEIFQGDDGITVVSVEASGFEKIDFVEGTIDGPIVDEPKPIDFNPNGYEPMPLPVIPDNGAPEIGKDDQGSVEAGEGTETIVIEGENDNPVIDDAKPIDFNPNDKDWGDSGSSESGEASVVIAK